MGSNGPRSWSEVDRSSSAALVGSYEESLLTGRMSTKPAGTLEFSAELGVFGQGHCKPALKCPPHIHLPFPATYYQLPQETPSPYVGSIDPRGPAPSESPGYRIPLRGVLQLVRATPRCRAGVCVGPERRCGAF